MNSHFEGPVSIVVSETFDPVDAVLSSQFLVNLWYWKAVQEGFFWHSIWQLIPVEISNQY